MRLTRCFLSRPQPHLTVAEEIVSCASGKTRESKQLGGYFGDGGCSAGSGGLSNG